MEDKEILEMIDHCAASRRSDDAAHLRQLGGTMNAGLGEWCVRRRRNVRIVMTLLLVALPSAWYVVLPQRAPEMVACNMAGGEAMVVDCARNLISIA